MQRGREPEQKGAGRFQELSGPSGQSSPSFLRMESVPGEILQEALPGPRG